MWRWLARRRRCSDSPRLDLCWFCRGKGHYFGFSPLDRLDAVRRQRNVTCMYCYGSGKAQPDDGAMPIVTAHQAGMLFRKPQ